jgi:sugar/nucleoside kinase (ribokinase family)
VTPTFLAVGHFCYDVVPNGYVIGGGAAYSTITARNLGWRARAITAVGPNFDRQNPILESVEVVYQETPETTIFDNRYGEDGARRQHILGVGGELLPHHIPYEWRHTEIAYLCPIADEVYPELVSCFKGALIGVTHRHQVKDLK